MDMASHAGAGPVATSGASSAPHNPYDSATTTAASPPPRSGVMMPLLQRELAAVRGERDLLLQRLSALRGSVAQQVRRRPCTRVSCRCIVAHVCSYTGQRGDGRVSYHRGLQVEGAAQAARKQAAAAASERDAAAKEEARVAMAQRQQVADAAAKAAMQRGAERVLASMAMAEQAATAHLARVAVKADDLHDRVAGLQRYVLLQPSCTQPPNADILIPNALVVLAACCEL